MATMVCVDSQFIETTWPRMPSPPLKLPPPFQFSFNSSNHILLTVLPDNESKSPMPTNHSDESAPYVPPRSRSTTLTHASLALCTENLGNETGADFLEGDAFLSDLKIDNRSATRKRPKSQSKPKSNNRIQLPPPLTTIAGVDSIRVRSYREDGRLIMEAVKTPARLSYFHVERSNGRLRLTILKSTTPEFESVEQSTGKVEEEETSNDDVREVGENGNYEEDLGRKVKENGNLGGAEIEKKNLQRPCRCNEAGQNNNLGKIKNNSEMLLLTREPLISIWVSSTS